MNWRNMISRNSNPLREGQVAFVTGGSQGIGLAIATGLARRGLAVALFARNPDRLGAAAAAIQSAAPQATCRIHPLDVADADAVATAFAALRDDLGTPDLLVNAAGYAWPGMLLDLPHGQVAAMMRVNYQGTVHACRSAIPWMLAEGHGQIVNVASLAGLVPVPGLAGYAAAKAAVIAFSAAIREELHPAGVKVSVLCPPDTDTPGYRQEQTFTPPETARRSARCGLLTAEQVAAALFAGLAHNRFLIIPGRRARLAAQLQRLCPQVLARLARW